MVVEDVISGENVLVNARLVEDLNVRVGRWPCAGLEVMVPLSQPHSDFRGAVELNRFRPNKWSGLPSARDRRMSQNVVLPAPFGPNTNVSFSKVMLPDEHW